MPHPKQHITDLAELCYRMGVQYVVISPGSRNAPLISAFVNRFGNNCISIVDERSAGYFALGLARTKGSPVVILSTSGTAVLNYGPSLAEAYYQHIPVLAITADRPAEWIDQQDNQTIRQNEVYKNFVKSSYQLPLIVETERNLSEIHYRINSAILDTFRGHFGPVHLNVPLDEPLYDPLPEASKNFADTASDASHENSFYLPENLKTQWINANRIMIAHGHCIPNDQVFQALKKLSEDPRVVIIAENISNCAAAEFIPNPEILLANSGDYLDIAPDLLIYSGGQVVSKRLKTYLRSLTIVNSWRIGNDDFPLDTFKQKNQILKVSPDQAYIHLANYTNSKGTNDFKNSWLQASVAGFSKIQSMISDLPFCDLKAFEIIFKTIPPEIILELGNSSVIRYSQLFRSRSDITYYSNRGVSGIDGCLSTAVGTAFTADQITLSILGDLSFVYDSNALWNNQLPDNLRIIVINNSGGDIFNLIDGPSKQPDIHRYIVANHPVSIQKLAEAFNLDYFCCKYEQELKEKLIDFLRPDSKAALLEIKTTSEQNSVYFRQIMSKSSSSEITK
jgi:2-succinyl-5-enolpyruvyl-6-hydroxy-3-cyclohexene-1-carboxylate synthase